jgi:hypothetical protein
MILAANFPDNTGYVLAAYLIFAALLLVYLGITAYRLLGLEKRLTKLTEQVDRLDGHARPPAGPEADADAVPDREKDEVAP